VVLQARHVQVSGLIDVSGGNGAVASNVSGGGGSAGYVYIEAAGIALGASAFFVLDGGQPGNINDYSGTDIYSGIGADGWLIIKPRSSSFPTSVTYLTNFEQCSADDGVPVEVSPYYDSAGLHVRNYGLNPADVVLNLSE